MKKERALPTYSTGTQTRCIISEKLAISRVVSKKMIDYLNCIYIYTYRTINSFTFEAAAWVGTYGAHIHRGNLYGQVDD